MKTVIGPDCSFYQDDNNTPQGINFFKMREVAHCVILRTGQNTWPDPDFKRNWIEAKAAGLPRGSYWFFDSRIEAKRQAEMYVNLLDGDLGELPLFGDFEDRYNGPYDGWRHYYNFMATLERLLPGKELGIYTGYWFWREKTISAGISKDSLNYFKKFPLWIANYGANGDLPERPPIPEPWDDWTLWQFTDNGDGTAYGVESLNIDLNFFNGTLEQFRERFKIVETPPSGGLTISSISLDVMMSDNSTLKLRKV